MTGRGIPNPSTTASPGRYVAFKETSRLKTIISIFFSFSIPTAWGQTNFTNQDTTSKLTSSTFYLYYGEAGLGSNMGHFLPTIRIKNGVLHYTYEQNSYWLVKENRIDTICIKQVRQSSIDSIFSSVQDLKDISIHKSNFCIMSGSIHYMTVSNGLDTVKFSLMNTFDYRALKIVAVLNTYLPVDKILYANEQMIKDAEECWARKLKRWEEEDKKKKSKKAKNKNAT